MNLQEAPAEQGKASLRLAAEQALEALETLDCGDTYKTHNAASALRKALAESANSTTNLVEPKASSQPEQEPVAWINKDGWFRSPKDADAAFRACAYPLYTAPPKREWVGLTEEEIDVLADEHLVDVQEYIGTGEYISSIDGEVEFARAIEAKLKEKNT